MLNSQVNFAQIHSIPLEIDELKVRANLIGRDAEKNLMCIYLVFMDQAENFSAHL